MVWRKHLTTFFTLLSLHHLSIVIGMKLCCTYFWLQHVLHEFALFNYCFCTSIPCSSQKEKNGLLCTIKSPAEKSCYLHRVLNCGASTEASLGKSPSIKLNTAVQNNIFKGPYFRPTCLFQWNNISLRINGDIMEPFPVTFQKQLPENMKCLWVASYYAASH